MNVGSFLDESPATEDCACYVCGAVALWEICVAGEDEQVEDVFACEQHARGHVHLAIVLPAETASPFFHGRG